MDAFYVSAKLIEDVRELTAVVVQRTPGSGETIAYYPCSESDYFREKIGVVSVVKRENDTGVAQIIPKGTYVRIALINCSRI